MLLRTRVSPVAASTSVRSRDRRPASALAQDDAASGARAPRIDRDRHGPPNTRSRSRVAVPLGLDVRRGGHYGPLHTAALQFLRPVPSLIHQLIGTQPLPLGEDAAGFFVTGDKVHLEVQAARLHDSGDRVERRLDPSRLPTRDRRSSNPEPLGQLCLADPGALAGFGDETGSSHAVTVGVSGHTRGVPRSQGDGAHDVDAAREFTSRAQERRSRTWRRQPLAAARRATRVPL